MTRSRSRAPLRETLPWALGGGVLLWICYFLPLTLVLDWKDLTWPVTLARPEALSITTYGKWSLRAWTTLLAEPIAGDFPWFYPYITDLLHQAVAWVLGLPPVVIQAWVLGPAVPGIFFAVNALALVTVLKDRTQALVSAAILSLFNGAVWLPWSWPADYVATKDRSLHVPFGTLAMDNAQSWGWVLFLPTLCSIYLAYRDPRPRRAIWAGILVALLFQVHHLTFVNVMASATAALLYENARGVQQRHSLRAALGYGLAVVSPLFMNLSGLVQWSAYAVAAWAVAGVALGWLWLGAPWPFIGYAGGASLVAAAPYLGYLLIHRQEAGAFETRTGWSVPLGVVATFFFPLLCAAAALIGGKIPKGKVTTRASAVSPPHWTAWLIMTWAVTFVLAFHDSLGWLNHPYRFAIHLVFPLAALAGAAVMRRLRSVGVSRALGIALAVWLATLSVWNLTRYIKGVRVYVNYERASEESTALLRRLHSVTTPTSRVLNPPEHNFPEGMGESALIANYSRAPGFIPDFRFPVWREAYENRVRLFCFVFPGYPHWDPPITNTPGLRGCEGVDGQLHGPDGSLAILDSRLKSGVLHLNQIEQVVAMTEGFTRQLLKQAREAEWKVEYQGVSHALVQVPRDAPPHSIAIGALRMSEEGDRIPFLAPAAGTYRLVIGGSALDREYASASLDGVVVKAGKPASRLWMMDTGSLAAGPHELILRRDAKSRNGRGYLSHQNAISFIAGVPSREFTRWFRSVP